MSERTPEELAKVYRAWPTKKLLRELSLSKSDYTEAAVQAMQVEIERRKLSGSEIEETVSSVVEDELAKETEVSAYHASPKGRGNAILIEGVIYLALGVGLTFMTNQKIFFWGAVAWGAIRVAWGLLVRLKK